MERLNLNSHHRRHAKSEAGFTLLDILFVIGIIGVLAGIAIPKLLRSRSAANEAATIGSLRTIHTAQLAYAITCGNGLYADSFPTLGVGGGISNGFLSPDMTASVTPIKSHYMYTMTPGMQGVPGGNDCNGTPTITHYYITAVADDPGNNGTRGFASSQDQTIWQDTSGAAPTEPLGAGGSVAAIQ
jgi:type II secretory pathway pseudopilin PulG